MGRAVIQGGESSMAAGAGAPLPPCSPYTTTDRAICPRSKGLFVPVLEPGFGCRDKKPWRLLSRVVEPGQNVPRVKKSLRPAGLEPKTYCLAHGFLPTQLSSTCDSVKNNSLLNYHVEGPFVRVGNTNRDKRVLLSWLVPPTGIKGSPFCPGWCYQPG